MAAMIEPSSQEALAWHRANTLGLYDNNGIKGAAACKHCPPERVEQHYFYPKPWEVLTVGPRRSLTMTTPQYGVVEDESLPSPSDKHDEEPAAEEQDTNPSEEKHDLELDDDEPEVIPPAPTRSKELVGEFERLLNSPL